MTDLENASGPRRRGPAPAAASGRSRAVPPAVALAIVLTGQAMAVIDTNIVNVAVPAMHASLGASGAGLQLIVAGYTIAYAVLLVTGARLGDILGHRRVYLAGVALFTLASLGCGLAPTTGVARRAAVPPGRRRRGDDPAGAQPDPAHLHRAGPAGAGDEPVRDRDLRRRRPRPGARRPAGLREPVRQLLAAGLPRQRPGRPRGARLRAAAARRAASTGSARSTCPASRCSPRPCSRSCCRSCSGSRSAGRCGAGCCSPRPSRASRCSAWWSTGSAARGGQPILPRSLLGLPGMIAGLGGLFASMVMFGGWLFGLALELQDGLGGLAAAGRAHLRPVRRRVRARQHELAAAARPLPRAAADGRVRGQRRRPRLVRAAAALRRRRAAPGCTSRSRCAAAAWPGRSAR